MRENGLFIQGSLKYSWIFGENVTEILGSETFCYKNAILFGKNIGIIYHKNESWVSGFENSHWIDWEFDDFEFERNSNVENKIYFTTYEI